ncbi:hypothetical protein HY029_00830 [Candidatus Gottesmanbacteria bacterium]|nr:hypothetical protein [Candidatus Gottesmanbacteria bacterium]
MIKVKKIITGGLEFVKDSAKQIAQTVSPDALARQALGQQPKNEFGDYLKNLGPNLSPEEMEKRKQEYQTSEQKELEEARKVLKNTTPRHMQPEQKPPELRPFEVLAQEEERRKAQQLEAQKKNPQPLPMPSSKQARGMLGGRKKSANKGFEGLQKDSKVG